MDHISFISSSYERCCGASMHPYTMHHAMLCGCVALVGLPLPEMTHDSTGTADLAARGRLLPA